VGGQHQSGLAVSMLASGTPRLRVRTWPKLSDFLGEEIHSMPSFGGKVKPSVPCCRFVACKRTLRFTWKLESAGKIDRPFLAQFHPSLTEVSHVAWHGAPLEMMEGTNCSAQRPSSLRPRCFGEVDPEIVTHIYLYLSNITTVNMLIVLIQWLCCKVWATDRSSCL
jgi:hypothetical protein